MLITVVIDRDLIYLMVVGVGPGSPVRLMSGPRHQGRLPLYESRLEPHWEPLVQCGIGVQIFAKGVLGL